MVAGSLKLALFGQPVAHSLSPRIHAAFGQQTGIALDYRAVECPTGALAEKFREFAAGGGTGANLTVPLKAEGLAVAECVSTTARRAGAVNTLFRRNGEWHGDNTDGPGLLADLDRLGLDPAGRRVLILGAGGAAAGVMAELLARRPAAVRVVNRSRDRAGALAAAFPEATLDMRPAEDHPPVGFDVLIQATSAGHAGGVPVLERSWLAPNAVAYDLNYGPAHAPFARWCTDAGIACHDGLGMLAEQAAAAFTLWTGQRPDPVVVLAGLRNAP